MNAAVLFLGMCLDYYGPLFTLPDVRAEELQNFPPKWLVEENLNFVAEHKGWLWKQTLCCWPEDREYWEWRCRDVYYRWDVWDDLRLAYESPNQTVRLYNLRRLRDKIGWDAYYNGWMPDPCDVTQFWIRYP